MIWVQFLVSAVIIVIAAIKLAGYGDVIGARTKLGGLFVGTMLLSMATSLPELLTTINSINYEAPNLAVGNIFGSSMFNMFMLALVDLAIRKVHILRRVALSHTLTASLAVMLTGMAVFFILAGIDASVAWVGVDTLVLLVLYGFAVRLIQLNNAGGAPPPEIDPALLEKMPSLRRAGIGFGLATLALVIVTPMMVSSAVEIAGALGVGVGFIGVTLVAIVTSLPEVVTTTAAVRVGAYDLAVGNLFGSNIFNIFTLSFTDLFFTKGRLMGQVSTVAALGGVVALLLTCWGLIDILSRTERRRFVLNIDALIILSYFVGMWVIFSKGAI